MKTIRNIWIILVSLAIGILYAEKYYVFLRTQVQCSVPPVNINIACDPKHSGEQLISSLYEFLSNFTNAAGHHFTWATLIITIVGIFLATFGIMNNLWRREEINKMEANINGFKVKINNSIKDHENGVKSSIYSCKEELKTYEEKLDKAEWSISFLEQSSHSIMQALFVVLDDYITRYENLSKTNTDESMKYHLATFIVKFLDLLVQYASAREIHKSLLLLAKIKNEYIADQLDKIGDKLFERCIRDSQFSKDAFATLGKDSNNSNDSSNPFKSLIEELKKMMNSE
jgi:hypothetical protein